MTASAVFQTQLVSVLETLCKAALLQIGKLFEDSSAAYESRLSEQLCENARLRVRVQQLEGELSAGTTHEARRSTQSPAQRCSVARQPAVGLRKENVISGQEVEISEEDSEETGLKGGQSSNGPGVEDCVSDGDAGPECTLPVKSEQDGEVDHWECERDRDANSASCSSFTEASQSACFPESLRCFISSAALPGDSGDGVFSTVSVKEEPGVDLPPSTPTPHVPREGTNDLCTHAAPPRMQKTHVCSYCGKSFLFESVLQSHMRSHRGKKPLVCFHCGKSFNHSAPFLIHQRSHTGMRPYRCTQCGKCFTQRGNLTVHERIHTGERRFKCSQCGRSFTANKSLLKHMRVHGGIHRF